MRSEGREHNKVWSDGRASSNTSLMIVFAPDRSPHTEPAIGGTAGCAQRDAAPRLRKNRAIASAGSRYATLAGIVANKMMFSFFHIPTDFLSLAHPWAWGPFSHMCQKLACLLEKYLVDW